MPINICTKSQYANTKLDDAEERTTTCNNFFKIDSIKSFLDVLLFRELRGQQYLRRYLVYFDSLFPLFSRFYMKILSLFKIILIEMNNLQFT